MQRLRNIIPWRGGFLRFGIGNERSKMSLKAREIRQIECKKSLKVLGINNFVFEERFATI